MKSNRYMDRALRSSDRRYAKVLGKLGYTATAAPERQPAKRAVEAKEEDPMVALRADYERVVGRKPWNGWDAATLKQKIADAGRYERRDMRAAE